MHSHLKRGDDEAEEIDETKFDEFMGNDDGVLAGTFGEYDQDDREADAVCIRQILNFLVFCVNAHKASVSFAPAKSGTSAGLVQN